MECIISLKVKVLTGNPHCTPHRMGEVLKYVIEQEIPTDADYEVLDWRLEYIDPKKGEE